MTIQQAAKLRSKFIETKRESLRKNMSALEVKLFNIIIDKLISELDVSDGKIVSNGKNIRLSAALDKIVKEFNNNQYAKVIQLFANDLTGLNKFNEVYFKILEKDQSKITKISKDVNKILRNRIGLTSEGNIKKDGYLDRLAKDPNLKIRLKKLTINAVIKGKPIEDFKQQMKNLVVGNEKVNGELTKHMNRFAYDTYQQYDNANAELWSDKLSLTAFIYNGGKIKASRCFCIERTGKVFTKQEANKWESTIGDECGVIWSEAGGKYNPLQDRGGYNCRHSLDYISNLMALRLRPDLAGQLS